MTRFVVDCGAVLHLASEGIKVPAEHELLAPTLLRSQTLSVLHQAVHRGEIAPDVAGREIEWDIRPLPVVYGDPALLRPVMINLLSNAVKYTGTRPVARIEVGATASDEGQTIYVRDNGVGFDMR